MKKQKRVFGVVYTSGVNGIDIDLFNKELAKWKAPKPVVALPYEPPLVTAEVAADIQAKAPTIITRLKTRASTTSSSSEATTSRLPSRRRRPNRSSSPSGRMTSFQVQELDLYARASSTSSNGPTPSASGSSDPRCSTRVGPRPCTCGTGDPNNGNYTTNSSHYSQLGILFRGIHLAGPKLNPQTFRDGFFSMPPTGGASEGQVINSMLAVGKPAGMPWNEYIDRR